MREMHYAPARIAALLAMNVRVVRRKIRAGEFPGAVNIGSDNRPDYRVPVCGLDRWLSQRQVVRAERVRPRRRQEK